MNKFSKITVTAISLLLFCFAFAEGKGMGQHHQQGSCPMKEMGQHEQGGCPMKGEAKEMWMNDESLKNAGVSENVRKDIRTIFFNMKQKLIEVHFKIKEERLASREEMTKDNPDRKKLEASILKIAELSKQQAQIIGQTKIETAFKLTQEQRKKLFSAIKEKREHFMKEMNHCEME